ncbi:MAG: ABC transporter permease [Candidatus ainarchaeum sp.]|nr:ABC transporter permease [Candidatus ainarchaeum sp.]
MKKREIVEYSVRNLKYTKVRSWLTMVGIFIGIMAIVVLIGLVEGLKSEITEELSKFGANTIIITPSSAVGGVASGTAYGVTKGKLFENDYEKIKKVAGVEYISKVISGRVNAIYKDEQVALSVFGIEPDVFREVSVLEIEKGRFLEENDHGTAVIGYNIAEDTFEKKVETNSFIEIDGKNYRVAGILKKTGSSTFNPDNIVFIHFEDAKEVFEDKLAKDEINTIRLTVFDGEDTEEISEEIKNVLLSAHKVKEEDKDFSIITSKQINERVEQVTGMLTLFLGAVAGISLIVGGIGIANTMFMNVIERTREIGILKAIGASRKEIVGLFVIEALILGFFGGILGVIVGWIVLVIIGYAIGMNIVLSPFIAIVSLIFSGALGAFSGYIPAKNASEISPMESLRYE